METDTAGHAPGRRRLETAAIALPALLAVAFFVLWGALDAGYGPTVWYPGALVFLALLAVVAVAYPPFFAGTSGLVIAALALFAAFTVWTFLSIVWAGVKGDAWDGANRTLLYLTVYAFFALWPWRSRGAALVLGAYSLGIAAVAVGTFLLAAAATDADRFFIGGRYVEPAGYLNADAALFLMAFWPALFLASRPETPVLLRGVFLASAGALLELAVLPQSRGSLFAFPVVLLAYIALVPGRIRSVVFLLPVAGAALLARGTLLDVYTAAREDGLAGALDDARSAVLLSVLALLAVGTALGFADRRLRLPEPVARRASRIGAVAAALGVLVALVVLLGYVGNPADRAGDAWREFKAGQQGGSGESHLGGGLGSNRYDFWRVALREWRDDPLRGIGADNFALAYVRERESLEEPLYPHSLEVQILSQTGSVGAALFAAFLGCALAAAWTARGSRSRFGRAVAATAVVTFGYWAVHGSVDWFWEFPGLGAPAFAWLGLAAGLGKPIPLPPPPRLAGSLAKLGAVGLAGAVTLAAAASYALPWLAARDVEAAARIWRQDAGSAFDHLDRARRLNFLSDRPDLINGVIAMRLGDFTRARTAFEGVLERTPDNWYAHLELAIIASLEGDRRDALAELRNAEALNPREVAIDQVRERVRARKRVSPAAIDRIFLQRLEERTS